MSDTVAAAEHRWDLAEQRARLVLRRFAAGRGPRPARRALLVSVSVVVELALLVTAVVLPPDAPVRWLLATVVASVALIVFIASVIVAVRRRGTPDRQPVIGSLSAREQRAVKRVVRGRGTAPDDRRTVVRAAAVQMAAADGLPGLYAYPVLWSALAASGVSSLSVLYLLPAVAAVGSLVGTARDAALARRLLADEPATGPGSCGAPQETDAGS
ncbi:hypothetical protein [Curtobacterium sp. ER1/6]|uniref:hypothetical protein n=1 Tax=Curtobacterium sp. ER1/6 TaxID=1891920 RepID=UPI00114D20C4|nr:hypothetical protein [Curtobacterium sp. ER1/6]